MSRESIYVEIDLDADVDEVWAATQDPDVHERWDLRFTAITYLPRGSDEPQRFTYATRMGGVGVEGTGMSTGVRAADGVQTSTLRFFSDDPRSLIAEGTGFWRYVEIGDESDDGSDGAGSMEGADGASSAEGADGPSSVEPDAGDATDGRTGVRFLTEYNYVTRHGRLGRLVDRFAFRPLLGWATAWSFDRLRLWIEDGVPPEVSRRNALVHALARVTVAFVLVYQGLVPKLLARHPEEVALLEATGVPASVAPRALLAVGVAEVALGLAILAFWHTRWLLPAVATIPVALTATAVVVAPDVLVTPFNPIAVTVAVLALGVSGYLASAHLPSARRCRRRPEEAMGERRRRAPHAGGSEGGRPPEQGRTTSGATEGPESARRSPQHAEQTEDE